MFKRRKQTADQPKRRTAQPRETRPPEVNPFRRGRTITGSASSQVVASGGADSGLQSDRTRAHTLTAARRKVAGILAVAVVALGVGVFLVQQFTIHVVVAHTSTDVTRSVREDAYQDQMASYFASYPLQRFRFMLNENRLLAYLQQEHPHIGQLRVGGAAGFGVSRLQITARVPVASWQIAGQQYYVDKDGVAFLVNYYADPPVHVADESGASVEASQVVASSRLLSFAGRLVALSATSGLTVTEIRIPPSTTRQIEFSIQDRPTVVRVAVDRPVGDQVEDAVRSLAYFERTGQQPGLLDVRVSGRAAYR